MKIMIAVVGLVLGLLIWGLISYSGQVAQQHNDNIIQVKAQASKVISEYNQQQEKQLDIIKDLDHEASKK